MKKLGLGPLPDVKSYYDSRNYDALHKLYLDREKICFEYELELQQIFKSLRESEPLNEPYNQIRDLYLRTTMKCAIVEAQKDELLELCEK